LALFQVQTFGGVYSVVSFISESPLAYDRSPRSMG
jgi:hypothetical protein